MKLVSDCGRIVSEPAEFVPDAELIAAAEDLLEQCKTGRIFGFASFSDGGGGSMGVMIAGMLDPYSLSSFAARRFQVLIERHEAEYADE